MLVAMTTASTATGQSGTDARRIALAVDSLARRVVAAGLTPAFGVAVVMRGATVHLASHGQSDVTRGIAADSNTLWYLASTSKSLTGFGTALLAHQGVLAFSTPITELLPGVSWPNGVRADELTLAHFLSHTHHLNDNAVVLSAAFTGAIPEARWPELISQATPTGNTDLVYSNFGYNVAAMVIDAKRPEGWRRFLETTVYQPAGMRETYARVSGLDRRRFAMPHDFEASGRFRTVPFVKTDATMNSAGGHLATLGDLARWITVQMDSGRLDRRQVFPAAAVALGQRQLAPQTRDQAKRFAWFQRDGWSAGWDIGSYEGEPMVSRFGSYHSTRSHISFLPGRRVGVVAMTNGDPGSAATDVVAAFVYDLVAGRAQAHARAEARLDELRERLARGRAQQAAFDSTRASRQRPLDRPLDRLTGAFTNPYRGTITFAMRDGALTYAWGVLSGPVEVYDAARHQMRIEFAGNGQVVAFGFDPDGQASDVTLAGIRFARTR
jgi:CubicO group peptidase (beta-lactamase class C family)